jgi:gas vesicle protein GvpG
VDLLTLLFRLPFLPVRGVVKLAELIRDEAESEYYNPAAARHELEESQRAAESGQMSDEQVREMEYDALGRIMARPGSAPAQAGRGGEGE